MSRTKIERCYRKMQADAKAFGAELLTEESIFIDDDHLDCVWYGGPVGGLRYEGYGGVRRGAWRRRDRRLHERPRFPV